LKSQEIIFFKTPASGTDFQNTGLLPVSAKLSSKIPAIWQPYLVLSFDFPIAILNPSSLIM